MSTPRIDPNDPKWTAYVLGELDAAEREDADRILATSAEARAVVDGLETAVAALEDALASEPALFLTPAQRAAVRSSPCSRSSEGRSRPSSGIVRSHRLPRQPC
jgi:anti-sigma-K factor RskA